MLLFQIAFLVAELYFSDVTQVRSVFLLFQVLHFLSMFFFSEFLLGLIYGNKYKELSEVLQLYLIVPFLSLLITPLNILIRRYEKTKFLVISYLISLSITLFTINFFLENFFIKGAICALILSQLSYLTVIFIVINKFLKK